MKCIRWKGVGQIERVTDDRAFDLVERKAVAEYVPRHVWKSAVRELDSAREEAA